MDVALNVADNAGNFLGFSFLSYFIHVFSISCYKIAKLENLAVNLWVLIWVLGKPSRLDLNFTTKDMVH